VVLPYSEAFNGARIETPQDGQYGSVFVPASLVTAYQQATNWNYFADRITAYEE
jgi:hypothetical protein